MKDMTGIEEIDGRKSDDAENEEDARGRLHGAFEIIGHIGNSFIRRFVPVSDEVYATQFKPLN